MANIIKIKRSAVTATPTLLAEGELAYSENSGNLFIGTNGGANLEKIGGNTDVTKLAGIEAGAQVNTVDDVNGQTGNVSLGLQDLNDVTFAASPNLAVDDMIVFDGVNWVNVQKSEVGVTDHGGLTGLADDDHTQYALVDGTRDFSGRVTIDSNIATGLHVTSSVSGNPEIQIDDSIGTGTPILHFSGNGNNVYMGMDSADGKFRIANASLSDMFQIESDRTLTVGLTTNYELLVTSDNDIPNKKYVDDAILNADFVDLTTAQTIAGAKTFSDDMIVNGDLSVNGTLTTINSEDLIITDNTITLNAGETGAGVTLGTSGILIDRGTADDTQWIWNEATDQWGYTMLAGSPPSGTFVPVAEAIHVHDTSDITTGTFADARIAESNVTQHEAAINHDALLNFVADEHIAHSGVTLTAGIGLTGGGDITTSRTFDLDLNSLVTITETAGASDYAVVYSPGSPTGHQKILVNDLLDGGTF